MNIYYKIFILIFLNGFTSIITQIVLYKEILSQVYANEIVLCFALSSWLISGALAGIVVFPKYFKKKNDNFLIASLGLLPVFTIIISLVSLIIIRNIKTIFNIPVEQLINIWDAIIITILFYSPTAFFLTMSFSLAGEILKRMNGEIKLLYIIETSGSIVAGILFTLFISGKYSNLELLYWLGVINMVAIYILYRYQSNPDRKVNAILIFILIPYLIPLFTGFLKKVDEESFIKPYLKYNMLQKKEGQDSKVVITRKNNEYFVFSNGILRYQSKNADFMEFLGWAMLSNGGYKNIMLVNGGYTGYIDEIQRYKWDKKITFVETDTDVADLLEKIFKNVHSKKNVQYVHGDIIYYLYKTKNSEKYDFVVLNTPAPNTFLNNRYYTYEFFSLLKNSLTKDGLIIFSLPAAENYFTKEIFASIAPVYKTIKEIFFNVEIIPGDKIIFLVSDKKISLKSTNISNNMKKNNIKIPQLNPVYIDEKAGKSGIIKNLLDKIDAKPNKILEPSAYLYNIKKELLMFKSNSNFIKIIFILFIFFFVLYRLINLHKKWASLFPYISMFLFSATTIILELCLVLIYQSFYGYLYRSIGMLYSFFMVGILIGAVLLMIFNNIKYKLLVIMAEILNLLILFYILNLKSIEQTINPNIIIFFIVTTGFFVGAIFNLMQENSELSILYGADLAGGAIGGILFGLLIFPLFGFTGIIVFNLFLLTIAYIGGYKSV